MLSNPHTALAYRICIGGLGTLVVIIGLLLVPLPGPGWLIVIIGLFVISSEFHWAKHVLHFVRVNVENWTHWIFAQPLWVRWTLGTCTAVFIAIVVWTVIRLIGLPDWVPQYEVLEHLRLR